MPPCKRTGDKAAAKPATKPLAKPATKPLAKPATKPLAKPATEPLAKPETEPLAKPATEHVPRRLVNSPEDSRRWNQYFRFESQQQRFVMDMQKNALDDHERSLWQPLQDSNQHARKCAMLRMSEILSMEQVIYDEHAWNADDLQYHCNCNEVILFPPCDCSTYAPRIWQFLPVCA